MGKGNFSDGFKRDAVAQITERGYPVAEVKNASTQTQPTGRVAAKGGQGIRIDDFKLGLEGDEVHLLEAEQGTGQAFGLDADATGDQLLGNGETSLARPGIGTEQTQEVGRQTFDGRCRPEEPDFLYQVRLPPE
jgi:hypothetical protein